MTIRAQMEPIEGIENPTERAIEVSTTAAVINDLSEEIGSINQDKGFREDWDMAGYLETVATALDMQQDGVDIDLDNEVADELRRAAAMLRTNVIGMKLALICSEVVGEALETLRDNGAAGILAGDGNMGEELADAKVRIDDLAHMLRIPIGDAQVRKVAVNRERPHKHGRKC